MGLPLHPGAGKFSLEEQDTYAAAISSTCETALAPKHPLKGTGIDRLLFL